MRAEHEVHVHLKTVESHVLKFEKKPPSCCESSRKHHRISLYASYKLYAKEYALKSIYIYVS